jgi:hypothetical protein
MKKIGLAIGASLIAFFIGLLALYTVIPRIAPDHVTKATGDTLSDSVVDSLIKVRVAEAREDSIAAVERAALEIVGLTPDSLDQLRLQAGRTATLRDSLQHLAETIEFKDSCEDSLRGALDEAKAVATRLEKSEQTAEEISQAFTQIENNEMAGILEHMHPTVLRQLYEKASAKDRSRILRTLAPDQAARFLESLVDPSLVPDSLKNGTTLAGDSTALKPTDSQLQ